MQIPSFFCGYISLDCGDTFLNTDVKTQLPFPSQRMLDECLQKIVTIIYKFT